MKAFVLTILVGAVTATNTAHGNNDQRLTLEAKALFRVFLASEPSPDVCQYGDKWSNDAVPEYVAHEYLGLTLHADLLASSITDPRDYLDPDGLHKEAFCTMAGKAANEKARFDAFERDKSASTISIKATEFSWPVFDDQFLKAIVVISSSSLDRYRIRSSGGPYPTGSVMRHPLEAVTLAKIYRKADGGWKLVATEVIGQT